MPFNTPRIGIPYFGRGEIYSATTDAARMGIIDDALKSIWEVVGDGVIKGFEVTKESNSNIKISSGIAMVNGIISRLPYDANLNIDSAGYVYIKKKRDFGGYGLYSAPASFNSFINPSMNELAASVEIDASNSVVISWSKPIWCDFVRVYRVVFGDVKEFVGYSYQSSIIDSAAPEGTDIEYFISAIQYDGIINGIISLGNISTPPSISPPPLLSNLTCIPSHKGLYVHWDIPVNASISSVDLTIRSILGTLSNVEVPASSGSYLFSNLEVGLPHYIDVQSVSSSGVPSATKTIYGTPIFSQGPISPIGPSIIVERNATTSLSYFKINWQNPVTTSQNADPNSPGQLDDASGNFPFFNMVQILEISSDGITVSFTGEEFAASSENEYIIDSLKYRSANGELLSRSLRSNTRYIISIRRMVNGWYSPPAKVSVKTGNLGALVPPSSGSASIDNQGKIVATWNPIANSSAVSYKISLDSASIISRTRTYDDPPLEVFGIIRSYVNIFDFFRFDFSSRRLRVRIFPTSQLSSISSYSILKQSVQIDFNETSTLKDIQDFFNQAIPLISIGGIVYTLNQLFTTICSDIDKKTADIILNTDVELSFAPDYSEAGAVVPPFDPNSTETSLVSYYINYYGGARVYAVDDVEVATYTDSFQLGSFTQETIGIGGEYNLNIAGTAYSTEIGFAKSNQRYRFSISSVDAIGNSSSLLQFYADSPLNFELDTPADPAVLTAEIRGGSVFLIWSPSVTEAKNYIIYRKVFNQDFEEIAIISGRENTFIDVGAEVDVNMVYVVKVIDLWGNMTQEPDNNNYSKMTYANARIVGSDFNTQPVVISASKSGFNSILSWTPSDEDCDGYEIWVRRPNEAYEIVTTVPSSQLSYTHSNALIKEGLWSYSIRPVRGEMEINVSSSSSVPVDSFVIAEIGFDQSANMVITSRSRSLGNGSDIVKEAISPRIDGHRHLYLPDGQDRRVDLEDYFELSGFISLRDGIRFTHVKNHQPIPDGAVLTVYINGIPYGGQFLYSNTTRTITFSSSILKPSGPFDLIESMVLRVSNVSEIDNQLEQQQLLGLYGEQMSSGVIVNDYVPESAHSGRRNERCMPLMSSCSSLDGFKFIVYENEFDKWRFYLPGSDSAAGSYVEIGYGDDPPVGFENLQRAGFPLGEERHVVVYDGCELYPDDSLLLATSIGLINVKNISTSLNWDTFIPCNPPNDMGMPHKICVSADRSSIIVLYPRSVDILRYVQIGDSPDDPRNLVVVSNAIGIDYNIKFIRDACSTNEDVFLVSDIGPMRISLNGESIPSISLMSLPDPDDTESYACVVDFNSNPGVSKLYISTKRGVFSTVDYGNTWNFVIGLDSIVRSMKLHGNMLYMLSDDGLVRYSFANQSSDKILSMANDRFRRMEIFSDRLIIIGNSGCLVSDVRYSILFSTEIPFLKLKGIPKFGRKHRASRSLFKYRDSICIAGDEFVAKGSNLNRVSSIVDFSLNMLPEHRAKIPTVFIDGYYHECGSYLEYSPNRYAQECVYFDDQIEGEKNVELARQYTVLRAENEGWAWRDFAAPVVVKVNNERINEGSRAEKPVDDLLTLVESSRSFSDLFANSIKANEYYSDLTSVVAEMTNNDIELSDSPQAVGVHRFTRANVRKYVLYINSLNSQIYSDQAMSLLGTRQSLQLKSPEFKTNLIANFIGNGVSKNRLDSMGIVYSNYGPETCVGNLGTYDPEDSVMLLGEAPLTSPPDGSDNPIYSDPNGEFNRPDLPSASSSVIISGFFSRPCTGNNECPPSGILLPPSAAGSLGGFGSSNSSSSSSVNPPGGGGGLGA